MIGWLADMTSSNNHVKNSTLGRQFLHHNVQRGFKFAIPYIYVGQVLTKQVLHNYMVRLYDSQMKSCSKSTETLRLVRSSID